MTHYETAVQLADQGKLSQALEHYLKAKEEGFKKPELFANIGSIYRIFGKFDDAIYYHEKALSLGRTAAVLFHTGYLYDFIGEREKARKYYREAINTEVKSNEDKLKKGMAYLHISPKRGIEYFEDFPLNWACKRQYYWPLGKAYEKEGNYSKAWDCFRKVNLWHHKYFDYEKLLRIESFIKNRVLPESDSDLEPIFIVGVPRSGTTLLEQMLDSHPKMKGMGERWEFPKLYNQEFEIYSKAEEFGKIYKTGHIDKMPYNFFHIDLIKAVFPKAKVINIQRNPLDTCLSCYKNDFMSGAEFAYDLGDLGDYYRVYERMIDHFDPFTVQYEHLVRSPKTVMRNVLDYLGYDWDENVLYPEKNDRVVRTMSFSQVREPISDKGIGVWENYEPYLQPLLDHLGKD